MISIMQGIINVMHLFTKRFVFVSVAFASSKRSSSCFSRLKARITRIPVRISLVTRFSLSISVWSFVNFGMAMAKSIPISTRISTTPTPRSRSWKNWSAAPEARLPDRGSARKEQYGTSSPSSAAPAAHRSCFW